MNQWCECDSEWEWNISIGYLFVYGGRQAISEHRKCPSCGLFKWIDADYENMMYDLRDMNR